MTIGGIVALIILAIVLVWLLAGPRNRSAGHPAEEDDRDYEEIEAAAELRAAEEEVRELDTRAQPGEEQPGDDWGPGTARPGIR